MERKITFTIGEYYHIYNCGVDGRNIIMDMRDAGRFEISLAAFNSNEPVGSLLELSIKNNNFPNKSPLVEIVSYCLNPNHFHLLLGEIVDGGISKYMRSFAGGYSKYFNIKHKRRGTLFQGPFKAKHIADNDYLLHLSVYINLNDKVHGLREPLSRLIRSSWNEYINKSMEVCDKNIILDQFDDNAKNSYREFALSTLPAILAKRPEYAELQELLY